jgi:lambda family phage tail tape measure protein
MATVDQITLKVGVEGQASLDALTTKLASIDKSALSTANNFNAFNTRILSANIQDIAVEAELGVDWMRILGQQGSEVLAAFGPKGAAAGAALALGIAIARPVLSAIGIDMRNLKEMITDLEKSTSQYIESQKQNQTTIDGLRSSYGSLTTEAKQFFETQESLKKSMANAELSMAIKQLQKDYGFMNQEIDLTTESSRAMGEAMGEAMMAAAASNAWLAVRAKLLGLNTDEARALAKSLKDLDANKPEEVAKTLNSILTDLDWSNASGERMKKQFTETIAPILKINDAILEQKRNISAAAIQASELNSALLGIQSSFQPDINASRRNFDQIKAARLEGELKIAEFTRQIGEKTAQDGVDRSKEVAAFQLRTQQDVNDKIKDFSKSQSEAYITAKLANDLKQNQLGVEGDILKLSNESKLSALNLFQYNSDILKNAETYRAELVTIGEQRRKNLIDVAQQSSLEKQAADTKVKSDELAQASMIRRQKDFIFLQQETIGQEARKLSLFKDTAILNDRERKNAEAIFSIDEERLKQLRGIAEISNPSERAAREKEINDIFAERVVSTKKQQAADLELQGNFEAGWARAYANYVDNSRNAFSEAGKLFSLATQGMEDAFINFAKTGKLSFKDLVNSMLEELVRADFKRLIAGSGGSGGIVSSFGKLLGFASGGTIPNDAPVLVGENGPEIISGAGGRVVTPNNQLGGSTHITYNISAVDAPSFQALVASDPRFIYAVTEMGRRGLPTTTR